MGVLEGGVTQPKKGMVADSRHSVQKPPPNESEILTSINTFAITRLVETAFVNISRIEVIWKVLIAHFDILSNCKV